jgi:hypothetical protein
MSISTPAPAVAKPPIVPLARDPNGRPLRVPPEAAFWRVRRHTRGRPRNVIGADRKPVELPLDVTEDDLEAMFGSGTYRLDLYDAQGEPLDVTTTVALGESEPANANQPAEDAVAIAPVLPANASDVRLVLEANVRATQLAFAHNERTLTASLRMADTLRDGIRDLASAQATWINTLASARGFFRNAPPPLPPAPTDDEEDEDEDDDTEDLEGKTLPTWIDNIKPLVDTAATSATNAVMDWSMKAGSKLSSLLKPNAAAAPSSVDAEAGAQGERAQGFEVGDLLDLRRAANKGKATRQHQQVQPMSLQGRIMADPQLYARVMAIKELLTSAEIAELFKLAGASTDREQQSLIDVLHQYSPQQAVRVIRHVLDERRGAPQMRITPIRVPASEAIPGTSPPASAAPSTPNEPSVSVHVAEAHPRQLPVYVRKASRRVADPDARVLAMLGARGADGATTSAASELTPKPMRRDKTVAKTSAPDLKLVAAC